MLVVFLIVFLVIVFLAFPLVFLVVICLAKTARRWYLFCMNVGNLSKRSICC